jgi:hypothetical protein
MLRQNCAHRITASTFVTIAKRPHDEAGRGYCFMVSEKKKEESLAVSAWAGERIESVARIRAFAHIFRGCAARQEPTAPDAPRLICRRAEGCAGRCL